MKDISARAQTWSRYWASGARHSCPGSFADHYGAATQAFWLERFRSLGSDDRVLELGCGNGSLIRYMNEAGSVCWPARIDGVDLAALDARWFGDLHPELRARVRLHEGTPASALPLPDGQITQVFSQFALEYFASDAVWRELDRVLAPASGFAAIMHHSGSHLFRLAQAEQEHCEWLLAPGGPFDHARRLLPLMAGSDQARQAADAQRARAEFNAVFAALGERASRLGYGDVLHEAADRVMRILAGAQSRGEAAATASLEDLARSVEDNRLRVAELATHALDRDGAASWIDRLHAMGFAGVELGEVVEQGYLFGWRLWARRP